MGKLFYIMGKSASGKDSIYQKLLENKEFHFKRLVIYTTRPVREGERDGQEYYFVTEEIFQELKKSRQNHRGQRRHETVCGLWRYFTADNMELDKHHYLGIGTLESYEQLKTYYGAEKLCPLYIEVEDGERLKRAIAREELQEKPQYEEMCRRFLSDAADFSEEHIQRAGIERRFQNTDLNSCLRNIETYLKKYDIMSEQGFKSSIFHVYMKKWNLGNSR